ncbi:mitochondrial thioredoxin [Phlyctema vagabunda]|uniref:Mitochondrial thioredoxin n=1 Tax=Phlyctema vagabunda TaxID=108571 RepID=A0ABR4PT43_9HELO
MITRSSTAARLGRISIPKHHHHPIPALHCQVRGGAVRVFSSTREQQQEAKKNRVFTPVRRQDDFETYKLLSTSSRTPLLTFWTASYCSTCRAVSPILTELIAAGVGEDEGGVAFCEVEYDAPDIMDSGLAMTYMITSMPTLLSFDRGEPQTHTKVTDPRMMKDREWLKDWIRTEAKRGGSGGGGDTGTGLFRGLFGKS